MEANAIQNNFSSGELSPSVWGRIDRPFYKSGLEICRNFIPLLTGGLFFRTGTHYSVHSRLGNPAWGAPFRFNIDQNYSLEFSDYKLRFHTEGGVILETAKNISGISKADPGIVTSNSHGFSNGDEVYISGISGMIELNLQFFIVVYIDANTFSLQDIDGNDIDTSDFETYISGGTVAQVYEIDTPYLATDAAKIKFCGSADLMYLTHPDFEPRVLIRSGNASWSLATYTRYSSTKLITAITKASPGVITCAGHGLASGTRIYLSHIEGMEELNGQEYLVYDPSTDIFKLKDLDGNVINTSSYTTYSSGGDIAIVRGAPLSISAITKADPGVITISSHGLVTYDKIYIYGITGMTQLNGNFYWVKKIDANSFSLTDEWGNDIDTSGYSNYTSNGFVNYIDCIFSKIGDFPSACGLYGGRMAMGGTKNDPEYFWLSMGPDSLTGESQYDNFTVGTADTDGLVFPLTSQNNTVDYIKWFSGTPNFLVIGTTGGVYKANGGTDGASITPTAILVVPVSSKGVADVMPLFVDNQIIYVEQGGQILRGFAYSLLDDEYKAFNKSVLTDELISDSIIQIAFAKGNPDLIYAVTSTGKLLTCTLLEQNDVAGWSILPIGGDGVVLSIVTEPQESRFDRVGIFVERYIDGHLRCYLEYFTEDPSIPDIADYFSDSELEKEDTEIFSKLMFELQKTFVRLDSSLVLDNTKNIALTLSALTGSSVTATAASPLFTEEDIGKFIFIKYLTGEETGVAEIIDYTSSTIVTVKIKENFLSLTIASGGWYLASNTVGGLSHLEGETVGILTDGGVHTTEEVVDGSITLDYYACYIIIGLKYKGLARTLDIETGITGGVSLAKLRIINKLFLKLKNSLGGKVGHSFYKVNQLEFRREGESYYDRPPLLFSGLKQVPLTDKGDNEKKLCFLQDEPLPFTLLAIVPSIDEGEEG